MQSRPFRCTLGLLVLLSCTTFSTFAANAIGVYGIAQAKSLKDQTGSEYVLYMGSFRNKQYATEYQKKLSLKTKHKVYLKHDEHAAVPYEVFLGPYKSTKTVKKVALELAGESQPNALDASFSMPNLPKITLPKLKAPKFDLSLPEMPKLDLSSIRNANPPWVAMLSIGPVWASGGEQQTLYLTPTIRKTYTANKFTSGLAYGEFFLGREKAVHDKVLGQLGFTVATTGSATISGYVWDEASPIFNNYAYNYQVKHTHVAVKGRLIANKVEYVQPWISGSLGVGFNQAQGFSNSPLISEAVVMPNFANNTLTAFTYTVSGGFEHRINDNYQAGVGYQFADWGRSQLNAAPGQTVGTGLALSHLYTNGFLINLSYHS